MWVYVAGLLSMMALVAQAARTGANKSAPTSQRCFCRGLDCPDYTVQKKYEVRCYPSYKWASTIVTGMHLYTGLAMFLSFSTIANSVVCEEFLFILGSIALLRILTFTICIQPLIIIVNAVTPMVMRTISLARVHMINFKFTFGLWGWSLGPSIHPWKSHRHFWTSAESNLEFLRPVYTCDFDAILMRFCVQNLPQPTPHGFVVA